MSSGTPTTYVRLQGGLGNQLFQYALGLAKASDARTELRLDTRAFDVRDPTIVPRHYGLAVFGVEAAIASPAELGRYDLLGHWWKWAHGWRPSARRSTRVISSRLLDANYVHEGGFAHQPAAAAASGVNTYFDGYWQSERYFKPVAGSMRSLLDVSGTLDARAHEMRSRIADTQSLCVNVRRGDFVAHVRSSAFHGAMGSEYYALATQALMERFAIERVFVFSDEPEWCDENLRLHPEQTVVDHRYAGPEFSWYLNLMASCSYFVIPNSSFGWWAAWLADVEPDRVVAPRQWFLDPTIDVSDLLNPRWVRM